MMIVDEQTQKKREQKMTVGTFAFFVCIPVIGQIVGMGIAAYIAGNILRLSARRMHDLGFLLLGIIVYIIAGLTLFLSIFGNGTDGLVGSIIFSTLMWGVSYVLLSRLKEFL
ncbi:hypothetical protein [Duganella sacchari]|nr:hypothetical protein [Duganella sacchari]